MATKAKKTADNYFDEIRECVVDLHRTVHKVGGILTEARKTLTTDEYSVFVSRLRSELQLTMNDIDAAIKVADGSLDEKLFFSGVASSKILTLKKLDQQRLLSKEKFPLLMTDGNVERKAWADMTIKERDQLLGPKGGGIRNVDQQRHKSAGKPPRPITFTNASFNDEDSTLILRDGTSKGEIELAVIVQSLLNKEQLEKFKEALDAKIGEMSQTV